MNPSEDTLPAALDRHQIVLPPAQVELLDRYCRLLWDWNEKLNLTRHTTYEKFVSRDLVDSMAFSQFLKAGERVLDVGTGGGVPGVVLAILRDDIEISMCESVAKKARAVANIVKAIDLDAPVLNARAEALFADHRIDTLVIRAVARLEKLLGWFQPHWGSFGRMLVLKGPGWVEERGEARHHGLMRTLMLRKLLSYPLPDTESESVLLEISPRPRDSETPDD